MVKFFSITIIINTVKLAHLFHREIKLKFDAPKGIMSDRGLMFTSEFWG